LVRDVLEVPLDLLQNPPGAQLSIQTRGHIVERNSLSRRLTDAQQRVSLFLVRQYPRVDEDGPARIEAER
jgi:hypothetical protein